MLTPLAFHNNKSIFLSTMSYQAGKEFCSIRKSQQTDTTSFDYRGQKTYQIYSLKYVPYMTQLLNLA